jgi:hypothetical protein
MCCVTGWYRDLLQNLIFALTILKQFLSIETKVKYKARIREINIRQDINKTITSSVYNLLIFLKCEVLKVADRAYRSNPDIYHYIIASFQKATLLSHSGTHSAHFKFSIFYESIFQKNKLPY